MVRRFSIIHRIFRCKPVIRSKTIWLQVNRLRKVYTAVYLCPFIEHHRMKSSAILGISLYLIGRMLDYTTLVHHQTFIRTRRIILIFLIVFQLHDDHLFSVLCICTQQYQVAPSRCSREFIFKQQFCSRNMGITYSRLTFHCLRQHTGHYRIGASISLLLLVTYVTSDACHLIYQPIKVVLHIATKFSNSIQHKRLAFKIIYWFYSFARAS